jgi:K+-transporting ATPase ATPase B chain
MTYQQPKSLFQRNILVPAITASLRKLDPRIQVRNPVMFVVEIAAVITTVAWLIQLFGGQPLGGGHEPAWFTFTVAIWLWLTSVFANVAEALAEGRGRAQAASLRALRTETIGRMRDGSERPASELTRGDVVVVVAGELIPGDGTVIEGIASVDESAITGESAPVIREAGGDRSAVTGGTRVLSDRIVVEITQEPGKSFLERMIALVEGAERRKTPNEIALGILLAALTLIFLVVIVALRPYAVYSGTTLSVTTLIALLVALIPTTIGALLSAIGIAGMDRLVRRNVLALSRPPATSTCCCSTRPGRSRSATGRRQPSSRCRAWASPSLPRRRRWRHWPTRRRRAARSWCSPSSTGSGSTTWPRCTRFSSPSPRRPG